MSTPSRIVARYQEQVKTAGRFAPLFSKLVQKVDSIEKAGPWAKEALRALDEIEKAVANDPDWKLSPQYQGLGQYVPEQQITAMRKVLTEALDAVENVGYTYNDINSTFLRIGLK